MARVKLDQAGLQQLAGSALIQRKLQRVAEDILEDSDTNIIQMRAIDTSRMLQSGKVTDVDDGGRDGKRIGYDPEYSAIVHEGTGIGRNSNPRPFLGNAAFRDRGTIQ